MSWRACNGGHWALSAYGPFPLSTHSERVAGNIRKQMSGRHPFYYSCLISWSRLASNTYQVHLAMEFPTGTLLASDPQNSQYWKCIISSTWFEISQKFVSTSLPRKKVQDILDHPPQSDARNIREDFATVYLTLQRGNDGNRHFLLEGNESQP